jgi:hypothetical protein
MSRPILDKNISLEDFKNYYWLKEELVRFCRDRGICVSGGKIEISSRIVAFLESGKIVRSNIKKIKNKSIFDWNNEHLSIGTVITGNYRNSENVRAFFKSEIGNTFRFNVAFMNWMRVNKGKTLGDAVVIWRKITEQKKDKGYKTEIAPQFEYNTYIRDFLYDNPGSSIKDAIASWKIKRDQPGVKKYEKKRGPSKGGQATSSMDDGGKQVHFFKKN